MKMKTVELAVGVFMLVAIASLLMLALQVSGLNSFFQETPGYKIKAQFSNIGSLKVKGKVTIAGVVVGRITEIELEPQTYNAIVWLSINPQRVEKLPIDTRASILTAGLLGDNYISLTPGFDEARMLKAGDMIGLASTDSAVILEQLIAKFLASQASHKSQVSNNAE